ncbi:hypothetical protein GALMADRAFT_127555 [Galerina marginata CBS 339.88]|uniref:Guanine nucleotide-binding protein subunit alpha n=1 Tax=Galerina marginata (strain CBS 339.88) TaxID=685588 RepID=A0A067SSK1_GALM3|nr:hypothetical protein GALMADRAFT_127555 [Galerina marginata CBS 339.88]
MGCVQSTGFDDDGTGNNGDQLHGDGLAEKKEIKMLLLGAGESGKSTILKQMRLIHQGRYTKSERESYKEIIYSNTVQSMRAVLMALPQLDLDISPRNNPSRAVILSLPVQIENQVLPKYIADVITTLYHDIAVQEAIRRSGEFQLHDSAVYYFNSVDRMASPSYVPTDHDILRSNVTTTGITQTIFNTREMTYRVFDVGGQRSERKKWINCFEDVTAMVFVVSLSEYDQMLREDESVNRMQEALTLFDSICNSKWFVGSSIILFLNKIDLFADKLPHSPLSEYFPDYKDANDDYDAACDYFLWRFVSLNQSAATKQIFAHYTCATDTKQVEFVLNAIEYGLQQQHLQACDLL